MAAKVTGQCACGRWSYRLTPLVGRKNNMIKLKGTTLYPPAVNDVLDNTDYVENYVVIVQDSDAGTDDVLIQLGLKYQPAFDVIKDLKDKFRSRIRVAPRIEILPVAAVAAVNYPAKSRKPVKFIDKRAHHV
jgi:phenylacetate-CoA ligase